MMVRKQVRTVERQYHLVAFNVIARFLRGEHFYDVDLLGVVVH